MDIEKSKALVLKQASGVAVHDDASQASASAVLVKVRHILKEIETLRKTMTDPLEKKKKEIIAHFRDIAQPLVEAEARINKAISDYRLKEFAKRLTEQERLYREAAKNPSPIPEAIIPHVAQQEKTIEGLSWVDHWQARVVDLNAVPMYWQDVQILMPYEPALNSLANQNKGQNPPPGVVYDYKPFPRSR